MKFTTVLATTAAVAGAAFSAPIAYADNPSPTPVLLGQPAELAHGPVVQTWTVSGLKPSSDVIPWQVHGTLWEATASNRAVQGTVQPIVSDLNARASNGETYRALFLVATPQGVNPAALPPGQQTSGKVYFDVTGDAQPDSVVYNDGARDLAVWVTPPPTPPAGSSNTYRTNPVPPQDAASTEAATPPESETPLTSTPASSSGTPLPATSAGTPLPGSTGTPLPADATPGAASPPTTAPGDAAATPAPTEPIPGPAVAPTAPPAPPAAGSVGTPLSPAAVPPAAPTAGEAPTVSPTTTTPVPVP